MHLGSHHMAMKVDQLNARLNVSLVHSTLETIGVTLDPQGVGLHNSVKHVVAVNNGHTGLVATVMTQ